MARFWIFTAILLATKPLVAQDAWMQLGADEFAVAMCGPVPYLSSSHGRILRIDSGRLEIAAVCPARATSIEFRGSRGIVGGRQFVMHTYDRGSTWETTSQSVDIRLLEWPSDDTLYAVTFNSEVVRSTDAGKSWHVRRSADTAIYSIGFVDGQHGYVALENGRIVSTRDGGATWEEVFPESGANAWAISTFGDTIVIAYDAHSLRISEDRGGTWRTDSKTDGLHWVTSFAKVNAGLWILGGLASDSDDVFMYSSDQGRTWAPSAIAGRNNWYASSIAFDGLHGVAVGPHGYIYRTEDGGVTWKTLAASDLQMLNGVFPETIYGLQVGPSGRIFVSSSSANLRISTDNGLTWQHSVMRKKRHHQLLHVFEFNDSLLIASGRDDALHRSTDGGTTWNAIDSVQPLGYPKIVRWRGEILMAGSNILFTTNDSGLKWLPMDTLLQPINDIIARDDGRLLVVGSKGGSAGTSFFARSKPNELEWEVVTHFDTINGLFSLSHLGGDSLIATGRNGRILFSRDLGTTWDTRSLGHPLIIYRIVRANENEFVAATFDGLYESYDGMATWKPAVLPRLQRTPEHNDSHRALMGLAVSKDGVVYAGGYELILARGLKVDSTFTASVKHKRQQNIHLRIRTYPNPSTGELAKASILGLYVDRGRKRSMGVYTVTGVKVLDLSDQVNRDLNALTLDVEFDTRGFAKGVYMLVLDTGRDRICEPIVIY